MPWHDASPWRRKALKNQHPRTPDQQIDEIERKCRAGDLSLRGAIEAARIVGRTEAEREPAVTEKE